MGAFVVLSVVNLWRCNYVHKEIRGHEVFRPRRKGTGHRLRGGGHQRRRHRRHRLRHYPSGREWQQGWQFGSGVPGVVPGGQGSSVDNKRAGGMAARFT